MVCMLAICLPALADEPSALHLFFNDGTSKWFLFSAKPVLSFADDGLTITTADGVVSYIFDSVKEFRFDNPDEDGIQQHVRTPRFVHTDNNTILVYGGATDVVGLYDLSGRQLTAQIQNQGDAKRISLRHLPSGVYIIRINNQSIKVTKK